MVTNSFYVFMSPGQVDEDIRHSGDRGDRLVSMVHADGLWYLAYTNDGDEKEPVVKPIIK